MHSNFNIKMMSLSGNEMCIMTQEKVEPIIEPIIKPKVECIKEVPKVEKIKPRRKKNV